MIFKSKLK